MFDLFTEILNKLFISLFARILIHFYSRKTPNCHFPKNWKELERKELDLMNFLLKLLKCLYIFSPILNRGFNSNIIKKWFNSFSLYYSQTMLLIFHSFPFLYFKTSRQCNSIHFISIYFSYLNTFHFIHLWSFHSFPLWIPQQNLSSQGNE